MRKTITFAAIAALLVVAQTAQAANLFEFDAEGRLVEARIEEGFSSNRMGLRFQRAAGEPVTLIASACRQDRPGTVECWLDQANPLGALAPRKMAAGLAKIDGDEMSVQVEHWTRKVVLRVNPKPVKLTGGKDAV